MPEFASGGFVPGPGVPETLCLYKPVGAAGYVIALRDVPSYREILEQLNRDAE